MKAVIILLGLVALVAGNVDPRGITYNRCSLARKLNSMGVPKSELAIWSCIAQHESSYRTWVVGPPNTDGSRDYGLFQLNDKYWCQPANGKFSYNQCKVNCNDLLSDDLWPTLKCARIIKNMQGFKAWSTWRFCSGNLPSIDDCFRAELEEYFFE